MLHLSAATEHRPVCFVQHQKLQILDVYDIPTLSKEEFFHAAGGAHDYVCACGKEVHDIFGG